LAVRYLGYTGATLALFAMLVLGWSIFSGMSWITAAERVGRSLEARRLAVRKLFERWQDRRIGREVAREREAVVEVEKKRSTSRHEPILIEKPPAVTRPRASRLASKHSRRPTSQYWSMRTTP
jgi:S-DNA-T family DNA segregation ATPase FtsK/SpoIIIE